MRLTLRTLLAYLDEILEPSQAEELSQKIRESDFASGLVHRIRNSMGRLRVSSPAVLGTGLANDANTVAQYLDNELPGDRVSDFERICLESDMHLAEVASCHQVLTLVLGEPAQVTEPLRARIYAIPHHYDSPASQASSPPPVADASPQAPAQAEVQPDARQRHWRTEDSAYEDDHRGLSRRGDRPSTLWIPAAMGIFLLGVAATYVVVERNRQQPVIADNQSADVGHQNTGPTGEPSVNDVAPGNPLPVTPPANVETPSQIPATPESIYVEPDASTSVEAEPLETVATPADTVGDPALNAAEPPHDPTNVPSNGSNDGPFEMEAAGDLALPESSTDAAMGPLDSTEESVLGAADDGIGNAQEIFEPIAESSEPDYGRFLLSQIAGFHHEDHWMRAGPRDRLFMDMRVRVPVAFEPSILVLGGSIDINLEGRSELRVREHVHGGVPHFEMPFGRALISSWGDKTARRVAVSVGERLVEIVFDDRDSKFAMEVVPYFLPGDNPNLPERVRRVRVWPSEGRVVVIVDGVETFVREQQAATIIGDSEAVLDENAELPAWVDSQPMTPIERQALSRLDQRLDTNQPLPLALTEVAQSNSSQIDLKSLSMRALVTFDRFGPIVESLGDYKMHAYWQDHIEELQSSIARGASQSRMILEELRANYGPDAVSVHRMLVGYSADQFEASGAADLVKALSHEELPYRVVASAVLLQLTGKTHLYKAQDSAAKRKRPVSIWEDRLLRRELHVSTRPSPLGT